MDLHDAYEAVAREIEETAAKYAKGCAMSATELARMTGESRLQMHFAKQRAEIARAVEEASKQ